MFGNNNMNPFFSSGKLGANNIQQSHQRLFGGDRNLATKDIAGAQPRQFNKHVWGHFQTNPLNSGVSYDPQQSKLLSPILGDNVQPLNRMIPNSSGMVFRKTPGDPLKQSAALLAITRHQKLEQQQQYPGQSPNSITKLTPHYPAKALHPTSQIREQNIFHSPAYSIQHEQRLLTKPHENNHMSQSQTLNLNTLPNVLSSSQSNLNRTSVQYSPHSASQVQLGNYRSPDSTVQLLPPQKEYKREMISSYELGRHAIQQQQQQTDTPFIDASIQHFQTEPPVANPIFAQNRNYGPDNVLTSSRPQQPQDNGLLPLSPSSPRTSSVQHQQLPQQPYPLQSARNPTDAPLLTSDKQRSTSAAAEPVDFASAQMNPVTESYKAPYFLQPQSNQQPYLLRPSSQQRGLLPSQSRSTHESASAMAAPSQGLGVLGGESHFPITPPERKHQPIPIDREATTNSQYGTYLKYSRTQASSPNSGEKLHYQSRRTNFAKVRLDTSGIIMDEHSDAAAAGATPTQLAAIKRREAAIRRGFNIIGNYPLYNGNRPAQRQPNQALPSSYIDNNYRTVDKVQPSEIKHAVPAQTTTATTATATTNRIAGVENSYAEYAQNQGNMTSTNNNISNSFPLKTPENVKLFDPKALKNLSNVKIY